MHLIQRLQFQKEKKVTIVSSDKDLMQLIDKDILMFDPIKKRNRKRNCFEKFGVYPEKVIDVQALAGDSSDNIPVFQVLDQNSSSANK